jgi:hypothetical protein
MQVVATLALKSMIGNPATSASNETQLGVVRPTASRTTPHGTAFAKWRCMPQVLNLLNDDSRAFIRQLPGSPPEGRFRSISGEGRHGSRQELYYIWYHWRSEETGRLFIPVTPASADDGNQAATSLPMLSAQ